MLFHKTPFVDPLRVKTQFNAMLYLPHNYFLPEYFVVKVVLIIVTVVENSVVMFAFESMFDCVPLIDKVKFLNIEVFAVDEISREELVILIGFEFFGRINPF